jgi:thiol:disulfide interchange protein
MALPKATVLIVLTFLLGCGRTVDRSGTTSLSPSSAGLPGPVKSEPAKPSQPSIYDEAADGSQQIADALVVAEAEHKRVLLQFGANWCGWCHRLHDLFVSDRVIAAHLAANYVVVLIDVNGGRNKDIDDKYGNPSHFGLPAIVVLDDQGNLLTTKDSDELEEGDHHSPEKVMEFLKAWAPAS